MVTFHLTSNIKFEWLSGKNYPKGHLLYTSKYKSYVLRFVQKHANKLNFYHGALQGPCISDQTNIDRYLKKNIIKEKTQS